jgi:tellurite resistance protein TehA-like permease
MRVPGRFLLQWAEQLDPGCFAVVMATGIVSIDVGEHGLPLLARALLVLNVVIFAWLVLLAGLRCLHFRGPLLRDFTDPARGAAFLTLVAALCVLGSQCVMVVPLQRVARVLAASGALLWFALIYLFFAAAITRRIKPGFARSINGGWLVAVVATQSVSVLVALLARPGRPSELFAALCLYLVGGALYLVIITLVVYRMLFFPLRAREFTPPYWIDMGALAITALAGSLFVLQAPAGGPLRDLVPFVKGFTLFFWAMASWWIPLLILLEAWRHLWRHVPLGYEVDDWDIVFPIGMYTVGTFELARALGFDFLFRIAAIGVYVNLLAWLVVAVAWVVRTLRDLRHGVLR